MYHRWWGPSSGWSSWQSLGDPSQVSGGGAAAIVGSPGGKVDVVAEDFTGQVFYKWWG